MRLEWVVPAGHRNVMLRTYIRGSLGLSASLWRRIKWNGRVTVNGEELHNAKAIVRGGDQIVCEWSETSDIVPVHLPLSVLYEDPWLLIVDKGPGMIIHPTHKDIQNTLVNAVAGYLEEKGESAGIHPLYRLDRNTTGVIAVAKSAKVQFDLTRSHDQICRHYIAFVSGHMEREKGLIDRPIGRKPGSIVEWMVREDGKTAQTEYTVLQHGEGFDVLRIRLHTGRTHQIRVHMASLGHPLLGDDLYGGPCDQMKRQALHAADISFTHPETKKEICIRAELPSDMKRLIGISQESGARS